MQTIDVLTSIYNKYRKKYRGNPDSGQLCCIWSTNNPPDEIYHSKQISSIESAFNIELSESDAYELYDMELDEAAKKIDDIIRSQCELIARSDAEKRAA